MGYKFKYYVPQKKRDQQQAAKKIKKKVAALFSAILLAFALIITLSEKVGGPLPTWNELYVMAGLVHQPHMTEEAKSSPTKVHFIDVGQGDAVLVEQDGRFCLIDTGPSTGRGELLRYLDLAGVKTLDYLVLTHAHADHSANMQAVLEQCEVKQVILPDAKKTPESSRALLDSVKKAVKKSDAPYITGKTGQQYILGSGVITVLFGGIEGDNCNNSSLILRFDAPNFSYLCTGDAEGAELSDVLEIGADVEAQLYKAGHHGAANGNPARFVQAAYPQTVVVSCGFENDFGHPHKKALDAFAAVGADVYRTDLEGTVVAYCDAVGRLRLVVTKAVENAQSAAA